MTHVKNEFLLKREKEKKNIFEENCACESVNENSSERKIHFLEQQKKEQK